MAVDPIPAGYPRVIPYLHMDGAAAALDFYAAVFDAKDRGRMMTPEGKVGHAEIEIGDSVIMVADEQAGMSKGPRTVGGTPVTICVYVADVDAIFAKALAAGGRETGAVEDRFYGDRSGSFEDPWGHEWHVMTHIEDVPPEEMEQRAAAAMSQP
jgi:PhnB protein